MFRKQKGEANAASPKNDRVRMPMGLARMRGCTGFRDGLILNSAAARDTDRAYDDAV